MFCPCSVTKVQPIPLELLSLGNFSDAPRARSGKTLFGSSRDDADGPTDGPSDSRTVWPFTIAFIGQGQLGGQYTLWTDSYAARADWQEKLQHAKVLRNEVNDAGKVFEMTPLSLDSFFMAPNYAAPRSDTETLFTGRVSCSCPFSQCCVTLSSRYALTAFSHQRRPFSDSDRMRGGCLDRAPPRSSLVEKSLTCEGRHQHRCLGGIRHRPGSTRQGKSSMRKPALTYRVYWHITWKR